ncbi:dienelactone hydrolase family protein [Empedobacter falsenii]
MKKILLLITCFFFTILHAQSYEENTIKIQELIKDKKYCEAQKIFEQILNADNKNPYDFYYGAISSVNCNQPTQALDWLEMAVQKGLGSTKEEVDYLSTDENFSKLFSDSRWDSLVSVMKEKLREKELREEKLNEDWLKSITNNRVKNKTDQPNAGFALYTNNVDSIDVPFLVFVPKSYSSKKPSKMIVYLHGGVVSTENFTHNNYQIQQQEPIFSLADEYNAIILYPFGKKDFGWVNQIKAFENILSIVKEVEKKYSINKKEIYLGGMSNGGSATFWFATNHSNLFKGFYAFSADPKLKIEEINFSKIKKPFYMLNAKDDNIFKFDEVESIYLKEHNKNWHLESLEKGDHGFIYQENGTEIMKNLLDKLIIK